MGAHLWFYFVPYERDINHALQVLRQREFKAGRYNPAMAFPEFPLERLSLPSLGAQHASIQEALEAAEADGTRSILDMDRVGAKPDYGVVTPLPKERLIELFQTEQPTRAMIEQNADFFEEIERGHGIYIIGYKDGMPSEIFFAGYSYD
jgi:hypothetical protein